MIHNITLLLRLTEDNMQIGEPIDFITVQHYTIIYFNNSCEYVYLHYTF